MTPAGVEVMVENGHKVLVEKNTDDAYTRAGAKIVNIPFGLNDTSVDKLLN
ncbi:hypothetical protein [Desulfobacter latus]